jgi:hypothetical protein
LPVFPYLLLPVLFNGTGAFSDREGICRRLLEIDSEKEDRSVNFRQLEQMTPESGFWDVRDQLKWHIYHRSERAFAVGDAARDQIQTLEALKAYQQRLRAFFIESLGGLPPSDTPLEEQIVGELKGDGFRVERIIFQSRPRHYVTANLYLPDNLSAPGGAVLFVCGHWSQGKQAPEYQQVCQTLALAGLVVLAQDPIGQGERFSYYEPSLGRVTIGECCPDHDQAGAQCVPTGDALARYFLHDSMRALDYLRSRPEVDPQRIGITGNSGGGTQSSLMMIADTRLAAAAPGTFVMNRQTYMYTGGAQDAEQIWPGFTAAGYDHEDILLGMAPRPVRVLAVENLESLRRREQTRSGGGCQRALLHAETSTRRRRILRPSSAGTRRGDRRVAYPAVRPVRTMVHPFRAGARRDGESHFCLRGESGASEDAGGETPCASRIVAEGAGALLAARARLRPSRPLSAESASL